MKKTNKLLPAKSVEKKALGGIIAATATNVIPGLIGGIFNNIAKRRAELRAEKDLMEQQILNSQPEQFRKGGRIYEYPGGGYVYIDDSSFYGVDEKGNAITEGYNLGQAGDGTYDRGRTIPALNKDLSKGIPDNKVIPLTTGKELLGYDEKGKPVYVGYEYPPIKPIKPAITAATELVELDELVRENSNSKLSANDLKRYKALKAKYPKESKRYEAAFSTLKDLNSETSSKNPTAKDILIGKATQTSVPKVSNPDAEAVEIGELYSLLDSYLTVGLNQKDLKRFKELKEMYPSDYEDSEKTIAQTKSKLKTEVQNLEQQVYNNAFNQNGYSLDDALLEDYVVKYKKLYSQEPDVSEILKERQRQANYKENNEKSKWISSFVPSPFPIGGYVNSPIQAEEFQGQKETIALPNDQLIETNAEAPHEQMPDQQITDVLPENSYVFSARNKLSAKTAMQLLLELGMDKKDVNKLKGKKEISPVDVSNLAKPTKNTANDYQTSELKERNRQAVLEKAKTFNELLKVLNPEEQPQMAGGGSLLNPNTYSPFAIPQIAMPTFNPNLNTTFTGKDYFTQRTPQISPFVNYQVPDVSLNYQNTPSSYNPFATTKMDLKTGIFPKPTTNYFGGSPYADSIAEKRANADLERYESSLLNDSTAMAERDLAWKRAQLDSASGFKGNSEKPFMKIPENRSNQNKMFSDKDLTLFAGNMAANLVSGLGTLSQQMYRTIPTNYAPIMNMNTEPEYKSAINSLLQSQKMATDSILNNSYNPLLGMANATNAAANTQSSIAQYMGQVANQRQQLQNRKLTALQSLLAGEQGINQNIEKERAALSNLKKTYPGELAKHTARDISNYVLDKDKKQAQMNQDRAILEMMMKLYNNPAITDLLDKAKNTVWGNK